MKILDKILYEKFKGLSLASVHKVTRNEWHCTLTSGEYLAVGDKGGVLSMSMAEREYDVGNSVAIVASTSPLLSKVESSFKDVAEFMGWKYDEESVWDIDC